MTITDLCAELNNWFDVRRRFGRFEITNGTIDLNFLQEGQYFRIVDSVFNNGVYMYPAYNLKDEVFNGAVWAMAIPPEVMCLLEDINTWSEANRKEIDNPYQSESFGSGGYSYSLKSGGDSEGVTWQSQFKKRLNRWRKI
jgi:hypothetical protein